jgi:hypothetical protein
MHATPSSATPASRAQCVFATPSPLHCDFDTHHVANLLLLRRRERQLADLVSRVRGTRALNGEASLLETPAVTSDGVPFSLRVYVGVARRVNAKKSLSSSDFSSPLAMQLSATWFSSTSPGVERHADRGPPLGKRRHSAYRLQPRPPMAGRLLTRWPRHGRPRRAASERESTSWTRSCCCLLCFRAPTLSRRPYAQLLTGRWRRMCCRVAVDDICAARGLSDTAGHPLCAGVHSCSCVLGSRRGGGFSTGEQCGSSAAELQSGARSS